MYSFGQGTSLEMPNATRWSLHSTCHNCSRFLACNMAWAVLPACFLPCCAALAMAHYCLPWKCWERFWGEKEDLHACGCGSALCEQWVLLPPRLRTKDCFICLLKHTFHSQILILVGLGRLWKRSDWGIRLGLQDGKKQWWIEEQNGDCDIDLCKIDVNFLATASLICLLSMSSNLTCLKNW